MRCLERGSAPGTYTKYQDARDDLAARMGSYCAYCEQRIGHRAEIEHVVSQASGGAVVNWANFLLSCRYCNAIKGDSIRSGKLWADIDNTILAFDYDSLPFHEPTPALSLAPNIARMAQDTITLCGLDRVRGATIEPTQSDNRWSLRQEAWNQAQRSLRNWSSAQSPAMADQIAISARECGFFSIWIKVFENEPQVVNAIYAEFQFQNGTYKPTFDVNGNPVLRTASSNY